MKTVAVLALAAAGLWSTAQAEPDNRIDILENSFSVFENQKQCIQGMHVLRHAAYETASLPESTWRLVDVEDIETRVKNRYALFKAMYASYKLKGAALDQYGWDDTSFALYLDMLRNICSDSRADNPEIMSEMTEKLIEKCYTVFNEFPYDEEAEFELIDEVGLPQDSSWDGFTFSLENGQTHVLNSDGTVRTK